MVFIDQVTFSFGYTMFSRKQNMCSCMHNLHVAKVFVDFEASMLCERFHTEEDQ
jgi:hypothetical protein